jgi:hypothetical protein
MIVEPVLENQFRFYLPQKLAFFKNATLRITVKESCWLTHWSLNCRGVKLSECTTRYHCVPGTVTYYPLMLWYDDESDGLLLFSSHDSLRQYYFDVEIEPRDHVDSITLHGLSTSTTLEHIMDLEIGAEKQFAEQFQKFLIPKPD